MKWPMSSTLAIRIIKMHNLQVSRQTFDDVMMPVYAPHSMLITKGKGSYLFDSENNRYIDFTSGIAVNCLGHNHRQVRSIIKKQSKKLIHVSNLFANDKTLTLALKLTQKTDFSKIFFVNSGAEANEAALKLARRYAFEVYGPQKDEIISFDHSFHGRTFFSVCVGGQDKYSDGFGPKPASITHLPFNDIEAFKAQISDKTCAVIVEPLQGEGGIIPAGDEFLEQVRALCYEHNTLLIFDEVQTGIGRTGKLFAYMHSSVKPDILTTAKGIAAGLPLGAVLTTDEIGVHFSKGSHGSTFGGSPLSCAVGAYIIDTISNPVFLHKVEKKHKFFVKYLKAIAKNTGVIEDIRGRGLLLGVDLKEKYQPYAMAIVQQCAKEGLFILIAGHHTLRIAPALNIKKSVICEGLGILEHVLANIDSLIEK